MESHHVPPSRTCYDGFDRRLSHHTPGACHIVPPHARFDARSGSVRAGQCATRGRAMSRKRAAVRVSDIASELVQLGRRRFLKGGLSLGALTLLTGCDLSTHSGVDAALSAMLEVDDRVQAALFNP